MKYTCTLLLLLLFIAEDTYSIFPPPRIYMVSVDIETQFDSIIWYSLDLQPDDFYRVGEYENNPLNPGGSTTPIAFYVLDTFYLNNNANTVSLGMPIGYDVWGVHTMGDGKLDEGLYSDPPDSTMYLQYVFDSCSATITLNWNDYNNWRGSNTGFTVFRRMSPGVYIPYDNIPSDPNITHYTHVLGGILPNQDYELFIQEENVDRIRRSNSNIVRVFTGMTSQSGSINADYATISAGNTIDLSFTVRGNNGQDKYTLFRSNISGGPFNAIDSLITSDTIIHLNDDTPFTSGIFYYKLQMINNCGTMFTESNLANNIIVTGTQSGPSVALSWNEYSDWLGGVDRYRIIRTLGQTNPRVDTLDGNTSTTFSDDVSALIDHENPVSSRICYHIDALEGANIYSTRENSISNSVCFVVTPDIQMPNAFIPNDGEAVNQVFEPVFSFAPEQYELIIFNRLGTRIWEGKGPWDGKVAGTPVPEGVYLYLLRVYNYSSNVNEINGKVVVMYR
jgi:hypothetical protein